MLLSFFEVARLLVIGSKKYACSRPLLVWHPYTRSMEALIGAASDVWLLAANQGDIFFLRALRVFHSDSSEICSMCCNIALDTSPQSLHARFVARVLVWLSRGNLTITFPQLSICDKSSALSLINISYSFSDGVHIELLSPINACDLCDFSLQMMFWLHNIRV